ncbi:hypothetical protein [Streptomyces sp. FH025]|uniref:hypothetical protein n=1 Tax=Streptomyces sp. FH025 TaxID=2815937 RepID=UPI001A9FF8A6|nr:hypothetical protein [Streptomyces sp. FH025]MBO1416582.1 hypothetical protein [Streptomyces sp. FH025]
MTGRGAPAPSEVEPPTGDGDGLAGLREEHWAAPFPEGIRGVEVNGVDLLMVDEAVANLVDRELDGGLDGDGVARLWSCIHELDQVLPGINEEYCAAFYARLRTLAGIAAAHHLPPAS